MSFRKITTNSKDMKRQGADSLLDFYTGELVKGIEEISVTDEDRMKENKIEDFGVEQYPIGFQPYNGIWRYEPVESKYFCEKMLGEKPTEKQQEFIDLLCGKDPFEFTDMNYKDAYLMWGKGSGKDTTVAKGLTLQAYKLCCLIDPQGFIGLGRSSPIDIVNVASNADQAKNIFFTYLAAFIKSCRDPDTGYNWFATKNFYFDVGTRSFKYMDLRERDGDIKQKEIDFKRGIRCHSLTSDRFTAEGKNIVIAVMDEVGAMRPDNVFGKKGDDSKVVGQLKSLSTSVKSRGKFGKLVCISYKYGRNCPMSILVRRYKNDPTKFVKVYTTYEVRTDKSKKELKDQFADDYRDDPETARMMYECKDPDLEIDTFFSNIFVLKNAIDAQEKFSVNPTKSKIVTCSDVSAGVDGILEPWFKGHPDYYYAVHADLAKGQVWKGGDAIGLALGHMQEMRVSYDKAWVEYYKKQYQVDLSEWQGQLRMGIVMDLMLQLTCTREQREVRISQVRDFIIQLQSRRNFSLTKVTLDRWGSAETIQELNANGIDADLLSMDKSTAPWHTMKDYMQQGIFKAYKNKIALRELSELIDTGKKIDHPELSTRRFEMEGVEKGSKDIADAMAGVTFTLVKELVDGGGIFFG